MVKELRRVECAKAMSRWETFERCAACNVSWKMRLLAVSLGLSATTLDTTVANPFPPYSLQKRPKPQICPKFVPAIVLGGSVRGTEIWKNLSNFVRKLPFFKF